MAEISATPRNPWWGVPADALAKVKELGALMAQLSSPFVAPFGAVAEMAVGDAPQALDKLSYGERVTTGQGETLRPDPALLDVASLVPSPLKGAAALKGTAEALAGLKMLPALAGIFAGKNAKFADLTKLKRAEKMEEAGAPEEYIRQHTGWERGADGEWRWEIDDSRSRFRSAGPVDYFRARTSASPGKNAVVDQVQKAFEHDAVAANYPDLMQEKLILKMTPEGTGSGSYGGKGYGNTGIEVFADDSPRAKSIMLHELQHGVQVREGFANGGAQTEDLVKSLGPDAYESYRKLMGEVEARNVQNRRNFGKGDRMLVPPQSTEDIARLDQVHRDRVVPYFQLEELIDKAGPVSYETLKREMHPEHVQQLVTAASSKDPHLYVGWNSLSADKQLAALREWLKASRLRK